MTGKGGCAPAELAWEQFWSSIDAQQYPNVGKKFEHLVEIILNNLFLGEWKSTGNAADGAHDFREQTSHESIRWAEAKAYSKNIDLSVISDTLIMATNEGADEVLFFSVSPLTASARSRLALYGQRVGKMLRVFDGGVLDQLVIGLCQTPNAPQASGLLGELCPSDGSDMSPRQEPPPGVQLRNRFTRDTILSGGDITPEENASSENQPFRILCDNDFLIDLQVDARWTSNESGNGTPDRLNMYLDGILEKFVSLEGIRPGLELLAVWARPSLPRTDAGPQAHQRLIPTSDPYELYLQPGETHVTQLYFQARQPGEYWIPKVQIAPDQGASRETGGWYVTVDAQRDPPLVGENVTRLLAKLGAATSGAQLPRTFLVHGQSGVGKTRFQKEARKRLIPNGYDVHQLDGRGPVEATFEGFVQRLLATLWRLPDRRALHGTDGADARFDPETRAANSLEALTYCDQLPTDEATFAALRDWLHAAFAKRPCALLIDNVQALPSESVRVLRDLESALRQDRSPAVFLVIFNENDLPLATDDAQAFYGELVGLANIEPEDGDQVSMLGLHEFSPQEMEAFLDAARGIQPNERQEQDLYDKVKSNILPRPLDLYQFLQTASVEDLARLEGSEWLIRDPRGLQELIDGVRPYGEDREKADVKSFLTRRWQRLTAGEDATQHFGYTRCVLVVALLREVSPRDLKSFNVDEDIVKKCRETGILRCSERSADVTFYHSRIEAFFAGKLFQDQPRRLAPVARELLGILRNLERDRVAPLAAFQLADLADDPCIGVFAERACTAFARGQIGGADRPGQIAAKMLADFLVSNVSSRDPALVIPALTSIASYAHAHDMSARGGALRNLGRPWLGWTPPNEQTARSLAHVLREGGSFGTAHDTPERIRVLNDVLREIDRWDSVLSPKIRGTIEADLLDRLAVAYYHWGSPQGSNAYLDAAARKAAEADSAGLSCLIAVDRGYLAYGPELYRDDLLKSWDQAIEIFDDNRKAIIALRPHVEHMAEMIRGQCATIRGVAARGTAHAAEYFKKAREAFDRELSISQKKGGDPVYDRQTRINQCVRFALANLDGDGRMSHPVCEEFDRKAGYVYNLCSGTSDEKFLAAARFLVGLAAELKGAWETACRSYAFALVQTSATATSPTADRATQEALVQAWQRCTPRLDDDAWGRLGDKDRAEAQVGVWRAEIEVPFDTVHHAGGINLPCQ